MFQGSILRCFGACQRVLALSGAVGSRLEMWGRRCGGSCRIQDAEWRERDADTGVGCRLGCRCRSGVQVPMGVRDLGADGNGGCSCWMQMDSAGREGCK